MVTPDMTTCRFFEVKTGDRKGHYVSITDDISREEQIEVMAKKLQCGSIQKYNVGFYNRHRANDSTIWRLNPYGLISISTVRMEKIRNTITEAGWDIQ